MTRLVALLGMLAACALSGCVVHAHSHGPRHNHRHCHHGKHLKRCHTHHHGAGHH